MSWEAHDDLKLDDIHASLVIVSDSLFSGENDISNDVSGPLAIEILSDAGINSINLDYYPDDISAIRTKIDTDLNEKTDLIVFLGGTGISHRDVTIEAINDKISKRIPGFGEEFRRRSLLEIQGKGLLSRAEAGTVGTSIVVALPGSPNGVKLGIEILITFLGHALKLLKGK